MGKKTKPTPKGKPSKGKKAPPMQLPKVGKSTQC